MSIWFLIAGLWLAIYVLMLVVCYLKKKYCMAENYLCQIMLSVMCESCKESCTSHKKLIFRSLLFALILTVVIVIATTLNVHLSL